MQDGVIRRSIERQMKEILTDYMAFHVGVIVEGGIPSPVYVFNLPNLGVKRTTKRLIERLEDDGWDFPFGSDITQLKLELYY